MQDSFPVRKAAAYLVLLPVLVSLWYLSRWNYLLFHGVVEIFGIGVSLAVFMLAWNARQVIENGYLLFLGIAYLFVGVGDLLHVLAYRGMGVFPGAGDNQATQVWLITRLFEAGGLLLAPLYLARKIARPWLVMSMFAFFSAAATLFYFLVGFPDAHDGSGLTPFKIGGEIFICAILAGALAFLYKKRNQLDKRVGLFLAASIALTILSEISFTQYSDAYGALNTIGHLFKVLSIIMIYQALVVSGLTNPYKVLFSNLKRSQASLRSERDFNDAILETAGALVVVMDRKGRIVRFNRACEKATGYSPADVQGKYIWDTLLAPEEARGVKKVFDRLIDGQLPSEYENSWVHRDGSLRSISWANTFMLAEDGSVEYVIGTGIDITERLRAERALRKSEEQYRFLVNHLNEGIWAIDRDGHTTFVNPRMAEMLGYDTQEMLRRPLLDFMANESEPSGRQYLDGCQRRVTGQYELKFRRKDGSFLYAGIETSPIFERDGSYAGAVAAIMDTSEYQRRQETLRKARDELETRIQERTAELSATIEKLEHEASQRRLAEENFRTVNEALQQRALQLRALALDLTQAEERERRRMAQTIHDHLQQMLVGVRMRLEALGRNQADEHQRKVLQQADELLRESIVFTRSLTVELSPPILYEMGLTAAIRWFGKQIKTKHDLNVLVEADDGYRDLEIELRVMLFQAVRELLFNIVKHARVSEARISLQRTNDQLRIQVTDQGVGFNPAQNAFQEDGGHFGLFSIRERIVMLGGKLELDSAPGQGTRMTLVCPLPEKKKTPTIRTDQTWNGRPSSGQYAFEFRADSNRSNARIRVLVADDHQVVREGLVTRLQQEEGIQVVGQASDGATAVELARRIKPDVVVMDFNMDPMGGVEAVRRTLAELPQTRVIGLSAHEEEQVASSMLEAGACCHFTKCGSSQSLIDAIRSCRTPAQPGNLCTGGAK